MGLASGVDRRPTEEEGGAPGAGGMAWSIGTVLTVMESISALAPPPEDATRTRAEMASVSSVLWHDEMGAWMDGGVVSKGH